MFERSSAWPRICVPPAALTMDYGGFQAQPRCDVRSAGVAHCRLCREQPPGSPAWIVGMTIDIGASLLH